MPEPSVVDLSAVPLFPLPSVVLFPRAVLPLHIFEDRYRAMTADALEGDRLIAMALLREGWEKSYYGRPAIEPVVCVGRIISHEELSDGKYNFLLEGLIRARVVQELKVDVSYRIAELQRVELIPASAEQLSPLRQQLNDLFTLTPLATTGVGKQFRKMLASDWPSEQIADLAAFTILEDVALKQSLLAEADVAARVARTVEAVGELAKSLPKPTAVSSNSNPSLN